MPHLRSVRRYDGRARDSGTAGSSDRWSAVPSNPGRLAGIGILYHLCPDLCGALVRLSRSLDIDSKHGQVLSESGVELEVVALVTPDI
jgi:hypothetical protein